MESLLDFIRCQPTASGAEVAVAEERGREPLPQVEIVWQRIEPFSFMWPRTAGIDPDDVTEYHAPAFAAAVPLQGRRVTVRIGLTDRIAAGMERKRANVFLEAGSVLIPLVQFVGANNYEETGRLASIIKKEDGPHLRPGEPVPAEYRDMPRCVYSEVVVGKNAARSVAVLAHCDDLTLMARHGLIRARWKGLL
ncbi:MAG TPA: hypothetical protein VH575_31310 [Gemmataceae bacterium]